MTENNGAFIVFSNHLPTSNHLVDVKVVLSLGQIGCCKTILVFDVGVRSSRYDMYDRDKESQWKKDGKWE